MLKKICRRQHQRCPLAGAGDARHTRGGDWAAGRCACGSGRKRANSEQARGRAADSSSRALAMGYAVRGAYIGAGSYPCRRASRDKRPGAAFSRVLGLSGSRTRLVALPVHARARTVNLLGQLDHRRRRARLPLPVVYSSPSFCLRDREFGSADGVSGAACCCTRARSGPRPRRRWANS